MLHHFGLREPAFAHKVFLQGPNRAQPLLSVSVVSRFAACTVCAYVQVVLEEVSGRQIAINNRAGRSNRQVDTLLGHVDALLAANGNSLFMPTEQPAAVLQPERFAFDFCTAGVTRSFDACM